MAPFSTVAVLWTLVMSICPVHAQELVASLDYGTFEGAYSEKYNISYWQKIPFAAPPVGENRFRAPQLPPKLDNGIYNSTQPFDMCPQRTVNGSEDCLYLGLYTRPWTSSQPLRPVVVVFYGGAYIEGSASFSLPPSAYPVLNVSSSTDLVIVYPNYRVNAFGFLPGRQIAEDPNSDLNCGLLDQDMALQWTHKYISKFGGDPEQVSIWGQSAGAGSVVAQVIARRHDPPLFRAALASSPFWVKTYRNSDAEAQWQYDMLANLTGCAEEGEDSLKCLKEVDVQTIRNASLIIDSSHTYNTSAYTWAPIIDGGFLTEPLSRATLQGNVDIEVGFGMYNTHEGQNFVPPGLQNETDVGSPAYNDSLASFEGWLQGYLPWFTAEDFERVQELYPEVGSSEEISYYNDSFTRAGLVYRDSVLACPAYWMAGAAPEGGWLGEYSISPAKHGSDTYWWNTVSSAQQTDPLHYDGYTGAFASFFMAGNPNTLKLTPNNITGVPPLKSEQEFVIDSAGFTTAKLTQLEKRCAFWRAVAERVPI